MLSYYTCVQQMTIMWYIVPEIFSATDGFFCHVELYPSNKLENESFEKMKKIHGNIIILHKYIIEDNHTIYGSWDMKCIRQN